MRVFGGVEFARLGENLTGAFQAGATSHSDTTSSLFTGAGPRVGARGQYNVGQFQFFGEAAGAGLIGTSRRAGIDFTTASPLLSAIGITTNNQALTSPNATQVVPSFDARFGAPTFPLSDYGFFKVELGYQVAVYFDAVNEYALSNVAGSPLASGVYLATRAAAENQLDGARSVFAGQLVVLTRAERNTSGSSRLKPPTPS